MEIIPIERPKNQKSLNSNVYGNISHEDTEIIKSLEDVQSQLFMAQKSFDLATDQALVDSFIYEIMSLNKKYEYYLKLCKERGLVAGGF